MRLFIEFHFHFCVVRNSLKIRRSYLIPLPMTNDRLYHTLLLGQCFLTGFSGQLNPQILIYTYIFSCLTLLLLIKIPRRKKSISINDR